MALCACFALCVRFHLCVCVSVCVVAEVGGLDVDHYLSVPQQGHQGGLVIRGGHHGVVESHLSYTQKVPRSKLGDVKSEEQSHRHFGRRGAKGKRPQDKVTVNLRTDKIKNGNSYEPGMENQRRMRQRMRLRYISRAGLERERDDRHMPTCMSCKTMEERNAASCTHMHGVKVVTW